MAAHRIAEAAFSAAIVTAGLTMLGFRDASTEPASAPRVVLDGGVPKLPPDASLPPPMPVPDAGQAPAPSRDAAALDGGASPIPGRDAGLSPADAGTSPLPRDAGPTPAKPRGSR